MPPPPSCSPFSGKSSWKMNTDSFEGGNGSGCVSTVSGAVTPGTTVPRGTQLVAGAIGVQVGAVVVPVYCTAVQVVTPAVVVQLTAAGTGTPLMPWRSEEHTSELQSRLHLVCRLLLEKKKQGRRWRRAQSTAPPRSRARRYT